MSKSAAPSSFLPPLWVLSLSVLALLVWLLFALKEMLVLLVLGYALSYIIDPLVSFLERRNFSRSFSVMLVFGLLVLGILLMVLTAVPVVLREYQRLATNLPQYVELAKDRLEPWLSGVEGYFPAALRPEGPPAAAALEVPELSTVTAAPQHRTLLDQLPPLGANTLGNIGGALAAALLGGYSITLTLLNLALLPIIVFYLSVDFRGIHAQALRLFPVARRKSVAKVVAEMDGYVSAFVRGQLLVGAILCVLYMILLGGWIGLELWLLLAVVAGFGNMIPYFGFLCGIVLSSLMALVSFDSSYFWHLGQVWCVFLALQFLEGTVITPKLIGDNVGLSPLTVILAIFAGGTLFGLLGVFLAVPGAAVLRVLMRQAHSWALKRVAV